MLADWLLDMARIGYGRSYEELRLVVKKILDQDQRQNPFTDNLPGPTWVKAFMRRHPFISLRQSESLSTCRAKGCSPAVLKKWFDEFELFLREHQLTDKAERLWNADESGFPLQHRSGYVLAPRGAKCVYSLNNSSKQQITTLVCVNAAGQVVPPMHVFPGERFHCNPVEGGVYGSYMGRSSNGWMDSDLFYGWLSNHFVNWIPPARPALLLLDGHSSHINLATAKFAQTNGILLYCLPPHTTHALQPCDVGVFRPLKCNWNKCVSRFVLKNDGKTVDKYSFAKVFKTAWEETHKAATIVNSFRGSGICPLNPKAISPEKLIPASVYVRVESDDDPNESNLALQSDSSSLDDSNSNPVEPSTSSGCANIGDQIDPDACNSSTCSSSANISEQIDIYSYQVEPFTSSGSASIGDQLDPDACNSSTCSSSANISEQIDIYSYQVEPSTSSGSASIGDVLPVSVIKLILMPVIHLHVQAQPTLASRLILILHVKS